MKTFSDDPLGLEFSMDEFFCTNNVDEIVWHAINAEEIGNHQARKFNASKWAVQKNSSVENSKPSGSSEKVFIKLEGQNRITCFNCKKQGHRAMECPKRIHLIENECDVKDIPDDPKEKAVAAETDELEIYHAVEGESLMVIKETTSTTEKKWLRDNIFR